MTAIMQDTVKYTALNKLGMASPLMESSPLSEGVLCTSQKWCEVGGSGRILLQQGKVFHYRYCLELLAQGT